MAQRSLPIFRVSFVGSWPEDERLPTTIQGADFAWEGSESPVAGFGRHCALVGAASEDEALGRVRDAVARFGPFRGFRAEPVRDVRGQVVRTPLRKSWSDVDWDAVQSKTPVSESERAVIETFLDAAEPMWIIVGSPGVPNDRERVEATLLALEQRGLVYRTREQTGEPGRESDVGDWWALTDEGWDVFGLIKSPRYH